MRRSLNGLPIRVPETSPMKRGLKYWPAWTGKWKWTCSRDFPDEEGTEIKTSAARASPPACSRDFPDEEGTEMRHGLAGGRAGGVPETSPMKRGLKYMVPEWCL